MKYEELLNSILKEMEINFTEEQKKQLLRYVSEIELFNPKYKLVGASGEDIVIRHIADCLAAVPVIEKLIENKSDATFCDLGSGAGLPGIVLAVAFPNHKFTLVERMARRIGFLSNVVAALKLNDRVTIFPEDLSKVNQKFDIITFRAFHPLFDILDSIEPLTNDDTYICAYKAKSDTLFAELEMVEETCKTKWSSTIEPLYVPRLDATRKLCILKKK